MNFIKKFSIGFVVLSIVLAIARVPVVSAETAMSDAHVEKIRTNCVSTQNTLNRLHAADALLRVNRGQAYESISVKLMASMNSRIALNRLDGRDMLNIAVTYEKELADFRTSYQTYEQNMTQLLKIDCVKQPVTFYDKVAVVRQQRVSVHDHVVKLHQYIWDYKTAFDVFSIQFKTQAKQASES